MTCWQWAPPCGTVLYAFGVDRAEAHAPAVAAQPKLWLLSPEAAGATEASFVRQ